MGVGTGILAAGTPKNFLFLFIYFLTYFLILTGANAVPNGREWTNERRQRQMGVGMGILAAGTPKNFLFISIYFLNLLFDCHRCRRHPKWPQMDKRAWLMTNGSGDGRTRSRYAQKFSFHFHLFF
jgi:hypothetical protein